MTPDQIKLFFDANAVAIMFAFGLLYKYLPVMGRFPTHLIPWLNMVGYILTRLFRPADAHAYDGVAIANGIGLIIGGFVNSAWAALIYDKLVKPWIGKFFGRHKSDIKADKEAGLSVSVAVAKKPS